MQAFQKYLFDHGLDVPSFNSLIRGQHQNRQFLPSGGQILRGRVKQLKSENVKDNSMNYLVVEADVGDTLFIEAYRESIYIHGHWMGKADLNYVLEVGKYQNKTAQTKNIFLLLCFNNINQSLFSIFR